MIERIVSGGQTGVDRGALDAALERGMACGGWCPRGRRAEDGPIPDRYPLREAESPGYAERTRLNVRDSDGTLVLTWGVPTGGTATTIACARRLGRPCLVVDMRRNGDADAADEAWDWIAEIGVRVLNVAGPRASGRGEAKDRSHALVGLLLDRSVSA